MFAEIEEPIATADVMPYDEFLEGLASFCGALLLFYSVFALMLLSLTAAEMHFGIYPGLTFWEVFFRTTGIDGECGTAIPLASEFFRESW